MAAPKQKLYHVDEMDSRKLLQTYFSVEGDTEFQDETLYYQIKKLHDSLAAGHFKGKNVYDVSVIHQLYTVSDFYPEITILKLNETCIMELNKWLATRTGAFDWAHAHNYLKELHGASDQGEFNKEDKLKDSIKEIVKFDLQKDNLTDPVVLEQADCVITAWLLEAVCRDQNDYISEK